MEARLIAKHRRETEGGALWNVLAGGEGFQGILREDWILVARQVAATKELAGPVCAREPRPPPPS